MTQSVQAEERRLDGAGYEELLAGIGRGDPGDFETFYQATNRAIYAYALSLTRSHYDAQDLMMETYLKIRSAAHLYRPQGKPMAWVFAITRNLARDQQRRSGREALMGDCPPGTLALAAEDPGEDALVLRQAIQVLGAEERQIILLHAVSGLKHREIAQILERPLSTVLSKYRRGLAKLRTALRAGEEG